LKPVWEKPSDILDSLREQRRIELDHIKALNPTINAVSDRLAIALLESIIHDSKKHAALCKALIDIERGAVRREMDVGDVIDLSHVLEEHIEVEVKMIKYLESIMNTSQDDRTRVILGYMLSDERRHHSILKRILEQFI
jgi:rubrerythrin